MEQNQEELKRKMSELYQRYDTQQGNDVQDITYFKSLEFGNEDSGKFEESDIFQVKIVRQDIDDPERVMTVYDLYQDNMLIASIDAEGKIDFTPEFLEYAQRLGMNVEKIILEQNGKKYDIDSFASERDAEIGNDRTTLSKDELEQEREIASGEVGDSHQQETAEQEEAEKEEQQPEEEAVIEEIAQQEGLTRDDIKVRGKINPGDKVSQNRSVSDVVGKNYTDLYIVDVGRGFAIWGEMEDGTVEKTILEDRHGDVTKSSTHIGKDGSVQMQNQKVILSTPDDKEGFAITVGSSGKAETSYAVRDADSNAFVTANTLSSAPGYERPDQSVRYEMERARSGQVASQMLDSTEHVSAEVENVKLGQVSEGVQKTTSEIPANDERIALHDQDGKELGSTTIEEEAEKLGISPAEYKEHWIYTDCPSDSILQTNEAIMKEQEKEEESPEKPKQDADDLDDDFDGDRGERPTPEDIALAMLHGRRP